MKRFTFVPFLLFFIFCNFYLPAQTGATKKLTPGFDNPPEIGGIPDQKIERGMSFRPDTLALYTTEFDGETVTYSVTGMVNLSAVIDESGILRVQPINQMWLGSETLIITVTDSTANQLFDTDTVTYTIRLTDNAPFLGDIPGQSIGNNDTFQPINLNEYFAEYDGDSIKWNFNIIASEVQDPNPEWWVNTQGYTKYMDIVAEVKSNGRVVDDMDGYLAAFINGEVRGTAWPSENEGTKQFNMRIYSNQDGDTVSFRYYDGTIYKNLPVLQKITFSGNTIPTYIVPVEKLDAGNIILIKDFENIVSVHHPDPVWAGTETAEFRVQDIGTVNRYYASSQADFTVWEGEVLPVAAPDGLNAESDSAFIELTWNDNSDNETGFVIQRKEGGANSVSPYQTIMTTDSGVTVFRDMEVPELTEFTYRIYAASDRTQSGFSNLATVISGNFTAPEVPVNLSASPFNNRVELKWNANKDKDLAGYVIYEGAGEGTIDSIDVIYGSDSTYNSTGLTNTVQYSYQVSAIDSGGNISERSDLARATPYNTPPQNIVQFTDINVDEDAPSDTVYNLSSYFSDRDYDSLHYSVTSTDSSKVFPSIRNNNIILDYLPDRYGIQQITVNVSDGTDTISNWFSVTVLPVNDAPVLEGIPDVSFNEDDSIKIGLNHFVSDVDNDSLQLFFSSYVLGPEREVGKKISRDGSIESGPEDLFIDIDPITHVATIKATPDTSGEFTVVFTAWDQSESSDSDTITVSVNPVNDAPVLVEPLPDQTFSEDDGEILLLPDLKMVFGDIDGDTLTFTATGTNAITGRVSGDSLYLETIQNEYGESQLFVTASDGEFSITDTIDVNIIPVNDIPLLTGMPDVNFNEDDSLKINLNHYVNDPDNDTTQLSFYASLLGGNITPSGVIRSRSEGGKQIIDKPGLGIQINIDETTHIATLKGDPDMFGEFPVIFTAWDPNEAYSKDTITVTVDPVNDAPTVVNAITDRSFSEDDGEILIVPDLKAVFGDIDSEALNFSASGTNAITARVSGDSLYIKTVKDLNGESVLAVSASDNELSVTDTVLIDIVPVNDPPFLSGIPTITFNEDDSAKVYLNQYVTDIDNDTTELFFSGRILGSPQMNGGNPGAFPGVEEVTISIDAATHIATIKGNRDVNGEYQAVFIAMDPYETSSRDTADIRILPVNDAPVVVNAIPGQSFDEDAGELVVAADLKTVFGDVDGDALTFSASGTNAITARVSGDSLYIKTVQDKNGASTLVVTASDNSVSVKDTILVNIIPVNDAPVLTGIPDISFNEDDSTSINLNRYVTDIDNDTTELFFDASVFLPGQITPAKNVTTGKDGIGNTIIEVGEGDLVINIDNTTHVARFSASSDSSGEFIVSFTVYDPNEAYDRDSIDVSVIPVNDPPYILENLPNKIYAEDEGEKLVVPDLNSFFADKERDSLVFSASVTGNVISSRISGKSLYITPLPDANGTANVAVTATDGQYQVSDTFTVTIQAINDEPYVSPRITDKTYLEDQGRIVSIPDLKNHFKDVDGDTLTFTLNQFGSDLTANISGDSLYIQTLLNESGTDTIIVTAADKQFSVRDTFLVQLLPVNDAPVLAGLPDLYFNEDDSTTIPLNDYVDDVDNDTTEITFTANVISASGVREPTNVQKYIDGNGNTVIEVGTGDLYITINNLTNIATVKAKADSNGLFGVEFTAKDDSNATSKDTIDVNVFRVNDPPHIAASLPDVQYLEDAGLKAANTDLNVNFKDVDFDKLYYSVTSFSGPVNAYISGDSLFVSTLEDRFGTDTLVVTATDGHYNISDTMLVRILAVNDAPVVSGIPDIHFNEDDSTTIPLNDYVDDVDNDTTEITFTANVISASGVREPTNVQKYIDGNGNTVIEVGTGDLYITINNLTNIATVKAKADSNGLFGVEFTAKDDSNATSKDTIDVNVFRVNDPPHIAASLPDVQYLEDAGLKAANTDLNVNFKDVDFDKLYYSVSSSSGPVNAYISGDSLFVSTAENLFGTDTLIVTATDGQYNISDTMLVRILPINDAPVLANLPDVDFYEDDSTAIDLDDYVYDVDNDTTEIDFTANVYSASNSDLLKNIKQYKNGSGHTVIEVGTGDLIITIDNTANTAVVKAKADSNGVFGVEFTAIDDSSATGKDSINVRVWPVNDPPHITRPLADVTLPEDAGEVKIIADLKVHFGDVDFDSLMFSVSSLDYRILTPSVSKDSLFITTNADQFGNDTLIVTASDGQAIVSDTMIVTLYPLNDAPVLSSLPDIYFDEDDSTTLSLNPYIYDVDNDTTQISFTANVISASDPQMMNNIRRYKDESGYSVIEVGTGDLIIRIDDINNVAYMSASPDSNGLFGVEFTAADDSNATDKDTLSARVFKVNDPPYLFAAVPDTAFLEDAGTKLIITDLKQHFKDVDFDTLYFFSEVLDPLVGAEIRGDSLFVNTMQDIYGPARIEISAYDGEYTAKDTLVINILPVNDVPVLENIPDITFDEDDSTAVKLNDYVYDVDNDTTQITFTANVYSASDTAWLKNIRRYRDAKGYSVTEVGTGDLIIRIDSVSNIAYISSSPDSNGYFGVEFTATDDSNATAKDSIQIQLNAVNDPPYLYAAIPDTAFLEDAGTHIIVPDLKAHFKDVDFDVLGFSVSVLDSTVTAEVRGDTLYINTIQDFFGINRLEVSAYDGQYTAHDTMLVSILPVNDTPVFGGLPDIYYNEDDSTTLALNDYLFDVDNDTTQLYFSYEVDTVTITPTKKVVRIKAVASDEEVNAPGRSVVTEQGAMILSIADLTHIAKFSTGPDSSGIFDVVFTVADDSGASASDTVRVTINPVNDPPVKHASIKDTVFLEDPGPIVMSQNIYSVFNDIDNDSLTFILDISGSGLQYSIIDSVFTIEPDSHYNGSNVVRFYATDGEYTVSDTFNVLVRSVNDNPRVAQIPAIIMPEDTVYRFDLDQYVYDPDNDTSELFWMAEIIRNTQFEKAIKKLKQKMVADEEVQVYQSDNRTVVKTAADSLIITINTSTHVATVVATLNFTGLNIPVVFTARDPLSAPGNDTTSITVTQRNDPPVIIGSIPQLTMNEDDSLQVVYTSFYPYISDAETPDSLLGIFATYSGSNFTITHTDLSILLKPAPNWFGIDTVYLSVTDFIDTVTAPIRVKVNSVNDLPTIAGLPDSVRFRGDSSVTIPLWDYVSDLETPDSLLLISFARSNDTLQIQYAATTGTLRLFSLWNFGGVIKLTITVRDQGNAVVRDSIYVEIDKYVGVDDELAVPAKYTLAQNYPNPFNPSTVIKYGLPKDGDVEIAIYNVTGQRVRLLVSTEMKAGMHEVSWDGRNDAGHSLPSGIYFYRMRTSSFNEVKKLIMIK